MNGGARRRSVIDTTFESLVRVHGPRVHGLLRRLLEREEDVQDVYQETWFALWKAMIRLQLNRDPWPFIRKTAVRKGIDRLRRRARSQEIPCAFETEPKAPSRAVGEEVDLGILQREERACLVLYFWESCTVKEISAALNVPPGTVKTWMFRARAKLRRHILRNRARTSEEGLS